MIEKSTSEIVLDLFFENPTKEFHLRELSRLLKLSMPTIITMTETFAKEELITKTKGDVMTIVAANRENNRFIRLKRVINLKNIYLSGISDYLSHCYQHPTAIILFGSFSRGEDIEMSDIDIAILTRKKIHPFLEKYEKNFKRKINIHEVVIEKISKEFKANLYNGIILEGSW